MRPGPFITRVINCGEIIAEPAMGDHGGQSIQGGPHSLTSGSDLGVDNPGVTECQWPRPAQVSSSAACEATPDWSQPRPQLRQMFSSAGVLYFITKLFVNSLDEK